MPVCVYLDFAKYFGFGLISVALFSNGFYGGSGPQVESVFRVLAIVASSMGSNGAINQLVINYLLIN